VYDRGNSGVPIWGEKAQNKKYEKRENRCWIEEAERRCRMCYEETETIEHMWNGCSETRERERKERQKTILKR
jgi:hypothetical protein